MNFALIIYMDLLPGDDVTPWVSCFPMIMVVFFRSPPKFTETWPSTDGFWSSSNESILQILELTDWGPNVLIRMMTWAPSVQRSLRDGRLLRGRGWQHALRIQNGWLHQVLALKSCWPFVFVHARVWKAYKQLWEDRSKADVTMYS